MNSVVTVKRAVEVLKRVLMPSKTGFGMVDSDGLIIVSQNYPVRKLSREQFEAEKRAEGCAEICYLSCSWMAKKE